VKHRHLGRSGLVVSRIGLGTMTWGRDTDEDDAASQLIAFRDAGGTLLDTANVYVNGESERVVGRLLKDVVPREEIVLATKAHGVTGPGPMGRGTSRGHLLSALDASLKRLQTDWIDLWQLHAWDVVTPWEEAMSALDTAVSSGRVRYAGVSNYSGWQQGAVAAWQKAVPGRAPILSNQVEYSLLQRGIEREVVPSALDQGIGLLPWSPLGRGVLTGKYRQGTPGDSRGASQHFQAWMQPFLTEAASSVVDAVLTAADGLGVSPVAVALSWVRDRPGVTAPIVGARTSAQLQASLAAESLLLPEPVRQALDDVSAPPSGYPEVMPRWSSEDIEI
jgi:aryl-alcohol dehydrogenase-like predicted oxidoreductase